MNTQSNAGTYLDKVQPKIIAVVTDAGGFSAVFPSLSEDIGGRETDTRRP